MIGVVSVETTYCSVKGTDYDGKASNETIVGASL